MTIRRSLQRNDFIPDLDGMDMEGLSESQVRTMQEIQIRERPGMLACLKALKQRYFRPSQISRSFRQDHLLGESNFVGLAIGAKRTGGQPTGALAIMVYVQQKAPSHLIKPGCMIPPKVHIFGKTYSTDVQEMAGKAEFVAQGGNPITSPVEVGTIGCVVQKAGKNYVLTNYHVVGNFGSNPIGVQCTTDGAPVGSVAEYVKVSPMPAENYIDAAIVAISAQANITTTIKGISPWATDYVNPGVWVPVRKSGAVTGVTYGRIEAVDGFYTFDQSEKKYPFEGLILISPATNINKYFLLPGDSGAVVFLPAMSNKYGKRVYFPVGLGFASTGKTASNWAFACSFNAILQKFGVTAVAPPV